MMRYAATCHSTAVVASARFAARSSGVRFLTSAISATSCPPEHLAPPPPTFIVGEHEPPT